MCEVDCSSIKTEPIDDWSERHQLPVARYEWNECIVKAYNDPSLQPAVVMKKLSEKSDISTPSGIFLKELVEKLFLCNSAQFHQSDTLRRRVDRVLKKTPDGVKTSTKGYSELMVKYEENWSEEEEDKEYLHTVLTLESECNPFTETEGRESSNQQCSQTVQFSSFHMLELLNTDSVETMGDANVVKNQPVQSTNISDTLARGDSENTAENILHLTVDTQKQCILLTNVNQHQLGKDGTEYFNQQPNHPSHASDLNTEATITKGGLSRSVKRANATVQELLQSTRKSAAPNSLVNFQILTNRDLSESANMENTLDSIPQSTSKSGQSRGQFTRPHTSQASTRNADGENETGEVSTLWFTDVGDGKNQCKICGRKLRRRKKALINHMMIHSNEKPYSCSFCDRKFRTKYVWRLHELGHTGQLPQCRVCGGRYAHLKAHMVTHSTDNYHHVCSVCQKAFRTKYHLNEHIMTHTGQRPYTCQDCGGQFRLSRHLKSHMTVHTKEKIHMCSVCGKMFSQTGNVKTHIRVHTRERPFHCGTCGKAFGQKSSLHTHQKTHTSEKDFICNTCGKQFKWISALQRHELIHSGVQPYECSVCGMKFNQSNSKDRHMRLHTGEKPYSCSECGERFTQSSCLVTHRRRHHKSSNIQN